MSPDGLRTKFYKTVHNQPSHHQMSSGVISLTVGSQMNLMWCWNSAIYVAFPTNMKVCYGFKNKISGIFWGWEGEGGRCVWAFHAGPILSPKISLGTRVMIDKSGNNISQSVLQAYHFISSHFADNKSRQKYSINQSFEIISIICPLFHLFPSFSWS